MERRTVLKPDGNGQYLASDFFVGAVIQVYGRQFVLHDADEYAFNYMEANPGEFPKSDIDTIQRKVAEAIKNKNLDLVQTFKDMDKDGNEFISLEEFRNALLELGFELTEQVGDLQRLNF